MVSWQRPFLDPLYGVVEFADELVALVRTPVVQRLRHVRLSNIDSIDIPAIANLSRFEHVIGVGHLAMALGFRTKLSKPDALMLTAAALLHDWAITSFGHLVEEALQYVGTRFDHEERLSEIIGGQASEEILGLGLQILVGRQAGLVEWAKKVVGADSTQLLTGIKDHIRGKGRYGRVIAGDIDIDNIDNVFRMGFHMGLEMDRGAPLRLAKGIVGVNSEPAELIFKRSSEGDIEAWRDTRRQVYERLMLSERDFAGKLMMLFSAVRAYEKGEITKSDWSLVDHELVASLLRSSNSEVRETVQRWLVGELWECTPLTWMEGDRPSYPRLLAFSHALQDLLSRPCFAYGIKDKQDRQLSVSFDNGDKRSYGANRSRWLLGIGSSKREAFTAGAVDRAFRLAETFFDTRNLGLASSKVSKNEAQRWLF